MASLVFVTSAVTSVSVSPCTSVIKAAVPINWFSFCLKPQLTAIRISQSTFAAAPGFASLLTITLLLISSISITELKSSSCALSPTVSCVGCVYVRVWVSLIFGSSESTLSTFWSTSFLSWFASSRQLSALFHTVSVSFNCSFRLIWIAVNFWFLLT